MNTPDLRNAVTEYLRVHPELHPLSARQLAKRVTDVHAGYQTWRKARLALNLSPIPRSGMAYNTPKTRKQERKAAFALYPNTHKIVVDTIRLKIVFHGDGGFKTAEKDSKKALAASLRLFRLARFETKSHDIEAGIIIMTLASELVEVAA